jgi:hypothetical protein
MRLPSIPQAEPHVNYAPHQPDFRPHPPRAESPRATNRPSLRCAKLLLFTVNKNPQLTKKIGNQGALTGSAPRNSSHKKTPGIAAGGFFGADIPAPHSSNT